MLALMWSYVILYAASNKSNECFEMRAVFFERKLLSGLDNILFSDILTIRVTKREKNITVILKASSQSETDGYACFFIAGRDRQVP